MNLMEILFGKPERKEKLSTLNDQQNDLFNNFLQTLSGQGQGNDVFNQLFNYFSGLTGNDSETQKQLEAPIMRQFNEQIIPQLAEQFAGMGSGNLNSSAFQNQVAQSGVDLSERLGALRAGLRQQGAQGLQQLASGAFQPTFENVVRPQTPGLVGGALQGVTPWLGTAAGFGLWDQFQNKFGSNQSMPNSGQGRRWG